MRDNPIHSFWQVMTGQIHDQLALGSLRWFTVAMAWAMFFGGLAVAWYSWRQDPEQRRARHLVVFLMRFIAAGMWYLGTLWKLPWPVAHGFKDWLTNTVTYSSFQWHADLMQIFLNHIAIVQPLVYLLEVFFAASLAFGFAVRFTGIVAALFVFNLLIGLYNDPTEWVWTYVGIMFAHGMFAADGAGQSLGVDHLLRRHAGFARNPALVRLHVLVS
jgi:MFS family permease